MKNFFKSILFIIIFIFIYYGLSFVMLPKTNIKEFGLYNTSLYEIMGEKSNSIDAIILGDSLVYSSIVPIEIYHDYGYTVFDCSEPAFVLPDAYKYYELALESQKPKIVILEGNMFFRNTKKRRWYIKYTRMLKNIMPLISYHNNWKNILFSEYGLMSVEKGYRLNTTIVPSKNENYMIDKGDTYQFLEENINYLQRFINLAKEKNIKLIIMGFPSQNSWNHAKDEAFKMLSQKYNFTYFNLNNVDLNINWMHDTKDSGGHLNYFGAQKATQYLGKYLQDLNLLEDHRHDKKYKTWNDAYERHIEKVAKEKSSN